MKRYFFTTTVPGTHVPYGETEPFHCKGHWQYLNLPNGAGHIVVMFEEQHTPDPSWEELPHLLEQSPLPDKVVAAHAGMAGVIAGDHTFHMARKLATLNPHFHP